MTPEHRTEALGPVQEPGPRRTPSPHAGRPQLAGRRRAGVGSTSHDSPGSRRVQRPLQGRSDGACDQRADLGRRIGGRARPAASGWRRPACARKRPSSRTDRSTIGQAGRRALLAGVAERGLDQVGDRQVEVGGGGDDDGVLARRLGEEPQVGAPRRGTGRGLGRDPVRTTAATSGWVTRRAARPRRRRTGGTAARRRGPGLPQAASARSQAVSTDSGAGLRITALPAASAASTPPAGMAKGKFHGGATTTVPERLVPGVEAVERPAPGRA